MKNNKTSLIGDIPKDWDVIELNNLIQAERKITYGIVQPGDYDGQGRYLVRGKDYSFGWVRPEDFFRVSDSIEIPYRRARLKFGDLILTIVGAGVGNVAKVPEWLDGANITQTTARIAIDENKGAPDFYFHYFSSSKGSEQVKTFVKGGAQPGLNIEDVNKFLVVYPPLAEQRKVAKILNSWDSLIENQSKLIKAKEKRKKALMQKLLSGDVRFKGFTDKWKKKKIGAVGEIFKGKGIAKSEILADGIPCIRYGEIYTSYDFYFSQTTSFISELSVKESQAIEKGDILFAGSGETAEEIGKCVCYLGTGTAYAGGDIIILRPKEADSLFLSYLLNSENLRKQKTVLAQGQSVVHLYPKGVAQLIVQLPSLAEQIRIAQVLSSCDSEIKSLKNELDAIRLQKKGLMQNLLTGKIRVKV